MRALLLAMAVLASLAGPARAFDWYVGDGSDGTLFLNSARTEDTVKTNITALTAVSDQHMKVAFGAGFAVGDLVLVIQMYGTGAGNYEFNRVTATAATDLYLARGLVNVYQATGAQVLKVNEYSHVTVSPGGIWDASAWNGTTGGVLAVVVRGSFTMTGGMLTMAGKGFRAGGGALTTPGLQGESTSGVGGNSNSANGAGGGGGSTTGNPSGAGGGGGGYGSVGGTAADLTGAIGGSGGGAIGSPNLEPGNLFFGGAGGASGGFPGSPPGVDGGRGGGIILLGIGGDVDTSAGAVSANGSNGLTAATNFIGGGGGGAGGSIRFISTGTVKLGGGVSSGGGAGGGTTGATATVGGNGGVGRIAVIRVSTPTGPSAPAFDASSADGVTESDIYSVPPYNFQATAVSSTSVSLSWTLMRPAEQYPVVLVSTRSDFAVLVASRTGVLGEQTTTYTVPYDNTAYYIKAKVAGDPETNYSSVVSTTNLSFTPTGVVFDQVSSTTLTASAYAERFSNLNIGLSATNISRGGILQTWHGESWATPGGMLFPAQGLAMASLGGHLYAVGGNNGADITSNQVYDPVTGTWGLRTAMPTARQGLGVAVVGRKLYAIGGIQGVLPSAKNEVYDPEADVWTSTIPLPTARYGLGVAAVDGKIYTLGGNNGGNLNNNEVYDVDAGVWSSKTPFTGPRYLCAAASLNGKVFLLGGDDGSVMNVVDVYDPRLDSWGTAATLLTPRRAAMAAVLGGKIFLLGGETPALTTAVEEFDYTANTWTARSPLPTARAKSGAAALEGRVHIAGGNDGAVINTHTIYDPGVAVAFKSMTPNTQYSFTARARNRVGVETGDSVTASTYTLAVATAPFAFPEVFESSITVSWSDGGGGPGASFEVQASSMSNFVPVAGSSFTRNLFASVEGLSYRNTTYYFRARAYNKVGETDFSWTVLGATSTAAELPTAAVPPFTSVQTLAISASWAAGNNPVNRTTYTVVLSTTPSFDSADAANVSISTLPEVPAATLSASFLKNTTYYLLVSARNHHGLETPYALLGATSSLAALPNSFVPPGDFPVVYESSVSVRWIGGGNPVDVTTYTVSLTTGTTWPNSNSGNRQLSTAPAGASLSATLTGLAANTTYYARVWAVNHNGVETSYVLAGTTVTMIETPTTVYIDEVTASTIVASAFAPGAAFSSMTVGLSGTNVALDGNYQGWHGESWSLRLSLTNARGNPGGAVVGGLFYVLGGGNTGVANALNERYDPVTNSWLDRAAMFTARDSMGVGTYGGRIYVMGGQVTGSPTYFTANEVYDPESNSWTTAASMPGARGSMATAVVDGKFYLIGGQDPGGAVGTNQVYDPEADSWTTLASIVPARAGGLAGAISGKIYVVGGGGPSGANQEYDPQTGNWTARAPMLQARSGMDGGVIGGRLIVAGGSDGSPLSSVEAYDPVSDTWTARAPMLNPRGGMASAVQGGRLLVATGGSGSNDTEVSSYDPGVASSFTALTPNTLYTFKAKARNSLGTETAESPSVSTYTLAFATVPQSGPIYTQFFASSVTVNWSSRTLDGRLTGPGASFLVQASTMNTFSPLAGSSLTKNSVATVAGLFANATHYFRVRAFNISGAPNDWVWLGSTMTAIETPTGVYVDEVTTHSIVASAYAPGPAFSSMTVGMSGANVAVSGLYQGWKSEAWTSGASMTQGPRSGVAVAGLGGRVFAVGGFNGSFLTRVESFDPVGNVWTLRSPMTAARERASLVAAEGRLYAIGGAPTAGTVTGANEEYDPESDSWATKRTMPTARQHAAAGYLDGVIYVAGGCGGGCPGPTGTTTTEAYSIDSDTWVTRSAMNTPHARLAGAATGGKFYAVGGFDGSALAVIEEFDPGSNAWTTKTPMPTARGDLGVAAVGGKVFAVGGSPTTGVVEVFDPGANSWSTHSPMPTPRYALGLGSLRGKLYAVGGTNGAALATVEVFNPGVAGTVTALTPNTLYTFKAKARNSLGTETVESPTVSTYTLAAATVPQNGDAVFSIIGSTEATVVWSSGTDAGGYNGAGATYLVQASTMTNFIPVAASSMTGFWFAKLTGLEANATNYFRVKAYNSASVAGEWSLLGATVTLANPAVPAVSTYPMVGASSMTISWDPNGNAPGTVYQVAFATVVPYSSAVIVTTVPYGPPSATATGLLANSTYYPIIVAYNRIGAPSAEYHAVSTVTAIETPTGVYFDEISSSAITASAYAPGVAFSSLTAPGAGTNVAKDGVYQGWHGEKWTTKTAMTTLRTFMGGAVLAGKLYVVGGTNGISLFTNEEYDPVSNNWGMRADLPTARRGLASVALGGRLYALGGKDANDLATNEEYNPESNSWMTRAPMPGGRRDFAAAVVDGKIYVACGYNGPNTNADFDTTTEQYDPQMDTWAPRAAMISGRGECRFGAVGGKLYAVGGWNGSARLATNEEYDPAIDQWSGRAAMPTARSSLGVGVLGGKLFAVGGFGGAGGYRGENEVYDPGTNSWARRTAMSVGRDGSAVGMLGGRLFVVGGTNGLYLGINEVFDPGVASSFTALTPNTLYTFKAKARNSVGVETGEAVDVSTYTLAVATTPAGFSAVYATSVTVTWSDGGGGAGASYVVQASTMTNFIPIASSAVVGGLSATLTDLAANSTAYVRVLAYNTTGQTDFAWFFLGSTVTSIEAASSVYLDEVTTHSIVAAAYAAAPAFSSMTVGLSGTNLFSTSLGGYAGWKQESWANVGPVPAMTARNQVSGAALGGKLYAIGGSFTVATGDTQEYDPVTNGWTLRNSAMAPRNAPAVAVLGGRIYAVGGENAGVLATAERYDPVSNAWSAAAPLPQPRKNAVAAVWADRLYLFGGNDGATTVGDVWSYDAGTDTWTARSAMPAPRYGAAAAALEGKIYVLGGVGPASTNQVYDPATDLWAYRAPMLSSRTYVAAVRLGGKIVVAGGDNGAGQVGDTEEYDVAANTWTRHGSSMPLPRYNAAAGALGGRMFVAGGWNTGTGSTGQTDVFDPGTTRKFSNLTPNTQYFFKAKTRNSAGVETGESILVSTYTLAVATTAGGATFNDVFATSATVNWSGGANGAGASFAVEASTMANYLPFWSSMTTGSTFAAFTGLLPNSTHYFRVRAYNSGGMTDYSWFVLGSTVTAIETPTTIYFDEVSSGAITASAYAPGAAFSSMTVGMSGTNIARDGLYQGWNSSTWTARADMLVAKQALSGTALGGRFYAIRGDLPTPINEEYDPVTNSWAAKTVMSVPRYRMGVAGLGGKIYAVGGYDGSVILDANEVYDPESDSWSPRRPMPAPRWALEAVAVNGLVYAIGGGFANEAYDPVTDTWTAKAAMSPGSSSLVVTAVGGKIYAVGGSNPSQNKEYDTATDVWTDRANLPTPRTSLAGASAGGKVYILGGSGPLKTVERFDPATNTWATLPSMPTGRSGFAAAAAGGKVYSYGGYAGSDSKTMEMFDPGTASSFTALTPNTLYTFKAKARNSFGTETAESPSVSTYTLAAAAGPVSFPQVFLTSITVSWSNGGGGPDASYVVQASTMADFLPVAGSSTTRNLFATVTGLTFPNATYYFRILPYNKVGATDFRWFVAGSTVTAIETPTAVYFDEISSNSITASAYAPGPAFSSTTAGLSGTNIARGGLFAAWHGESWAPRAVMSTARHNAAAAAVSGRVYVIGGNDTLGNPLATNEEYDPAADAWAPKANMSSARLGLCAAALEGKVYAVGGAQGPKNQNEEFDPESNSWRSRAAMPTPREDLSVVAFSRRLYAVGGRDGTPVAANEVYDPRSDSWASKANIPTPRSVMGAAASGGRLYFMGGNDGSGAVSVNEEYDPSANAWANEPAMPQPLRDFPLVEIGGKLYKFGGEAGGVRLSTVSAYDPATQSWSTRTAMTTARQGRAGVQAAGRVYVIGGWAGGPVLDTNEVFDPGVASSFTGLTPNTQYDFTAKARNSVGSETAETAVFSTYTYAAVPGMHGNPFPQVFISSVQVQWLANNNPSPATPYRLHASTASDFNVAASSAVADWDTSLSTFAVGLAGNTTYYFRVRAKNFHGIETGYLVVGQAATTPFPPASAASTFSAVLGTSLDLSWDSNGNGPATLYEAVLSTQPLPNALTNVSVTTRPAGLPGAAVPGLISNATYYAAVRAISHSGAPTAFTQLGSTVTRVNPPVTVVSTFSAVYGSSFTAVWGGNGNNVGTRYEAVAATSSVLDLLDPAAVPVSTEPYGAEGADFTGLSANTTYYLFVAARARTGELTAYVALGSTATLVNEPASAVSTFSSVTDAAMTVSWSTNSNAAGTRYNVVLTTGAVLDLALSGNRTVSTDCWSAPAASTTGLADNTTYYLFVQAVSRGGSPTPYVALGSTMTAAAAPTTVYIDEVSSTAVTASAYAPAPAFSNLHLGLAGTNVAKDGAYAGWHGSTWTARAVMGVTRQAMGAAALGGKLYAVGGYNGAHLNAADAYDPASNSWSGLAAMTTARERLGLAAAEGRLFAIGGSNASFEALNSNEAYDPDANAWTTVSAMPTARQGPAVAAVAGAIYAVGGCTGTCGGGPGSSTNERYDPVSDTWSSRTVMPTPREVLAAAEAGGKLYALGGQGGALSADNEEYDPATNSWAAKAAMPAVLREFSAVGVGGKVYTFGGYNSVQVSTVQVYDPGANAWDPLPALGSARRLTGAAALAGRIYLLGGYDGAFRNLNESFDPGVSSSFTALTPNTLYSFKAKARNQVGTETTESPSVSTYTLAAVPAAGAPETFQTVWESSAAFRWSANGNPTGTEFEARASTASDFNAGAAVIVSTWQVAVSSAFSGLAVNATYYFQVRARNAYKNPTAFFVLGSTVTGAAVPSGPAGAASTFTAVGSTYMTVNWDANGNPAGTQYLARISTSSSFGGGALVLENAWTSLSSETFVNLSTDTVYYAAVKARNHALVETDYHNLGSTATPVALPVASSQPFPMVGVSSATFQWGANGNPPTTLFEVQAATSSGFSGWTWDSGLGAMLSTTSAVLEGDTTYYWRVRAKGVNGGFTQAVVLGATQTYVADPQAPALRSVGPSSVRLDWGTGGNREAAEVGPWSFAQQLPQARERHGAAWVNGRVYVVGGVVSGVSSAEVWSASAAVDGTLGSWRAEASLPAARQSLALAVVSGRLYVVGGFEGVARKTVYFAPVGADGVLGTWTQTTDLPAARYNLAAAADGGWLYALGGDNGIVSQSTVYAAPVANDGTVGSWTTATALPGARNSHAAAAAGGRVFVAGGLGAGVAAEVWSAPLSGATVGPWTTGAPLATPVFRHALVATPGALVALGGHDGTSAVATVQAAVVDGAGLVGAWGARTPLAQARLGHAAVLDGKALLVFGGTDGAVASSSVELSSPTGTEYLAERALDGAFTSGYASSTWRAGAAAELGGLTPNRAYFFQVRSRSRSGAVGPPSAVLSTVTLAAVPTASSAPFLSVEAGSATVNWGGGANFAGTEFLAALSTAPNITGSLLLSDWTTGVSSTVFGLAPNTTYYAVAAARNTAGTMTPPVYLGSTVTAAAVPFSVGFDSVQAAGFSVSWSTAGNPAGTVYSVQTSTDQTFASVEASSVTVSSSVVFSGLQGAATYYLRVRAANSVGTASAFSNIASTVTGQDLVPPSGVTDLTANPTPTPGTMLAAWTITGDDGTSGLLTPGSKFYVQWAAAPAASVAWSTANAQVLSSTGPAQSGAQAGLLVTGLPVGSWVSVRVWTLDEVGNVSALSNAAYALVSPFTLTALDGSGTDAGRGASVALERTGNAHAAYTAGTTTQELRYMTRSGGVWSVAEAPDPGTPAADARIAVASGTPQILYRNPVSGGLRIARRSGSWAASAVAAGNLVPGGLALDATGFAHVSYYDAAAGDLRYARFDGTAWQTEPVDAAGDVGRFSSLVLAPSALPAVAYYDSTNKRLKYSTRSAAGVWSASVVDSGVDVGSTPVLGMSADESARIAYIDSGSKLLKVAAWSGAAWTIQAVDSFAGAASVGGLTFDGAGNPLVSYHDAAAGDLRLARWTGTGWSTGTVASFGSVGLDSDLQVESDGGVTVLFYDASAGDLGSATWAGGLSAPLGGNARGRLFAPASFSGVVASSITVQWLWTDSVDAEAGWRIYGGLASTGPFSLVASTTALPGTAGTGSQLVYNETNLLPGTTYFRYAVAVASSGFVFSPMAQARPVDTTDSTPPTIVRNQTGDAVWRQAGGALYDVDFIDPGGSGLAAFSVKASTRSGGLGPDLIGYTAVASGSLGETYSADWALPAAVFSALLEGVTNYITVQAIDGNGNASVMADAFYVLKDTTAPTIDNYQAGGDTVPRSAAGTLYDVDAVDAGAGLERFQYSVSTAPLAADGGVLGWTDIPLTAGTTGFTAGWSVSFSPLLSGASNFVSVRAIDRAGSTTTVTDAFFVRKDTTGATVAVSTPPAGFPSAMGAISGTAADPSGVAAVQISIQTGGLWWNGSIFASVPQTWLTATGTAAWTYSSVPVWADGTAYRVVARASDTVGNFSTAYSTVDFTLDASSPGISVTLPAPGAVLSSLAAISGTAADSGAGLDWIRVSLRRSSDSASWDWNASSWSVAAVSTTPAVAASWSLPVSEALRSNLADGASYFVSAWAADLAAPANVGGLSAGATAFTWADSAPPSDITDLSALSGSAPGSISLTWTAPGDDGAAGIVLTGEYRVHYSSTQPVSFSTSAAQVVVATASVSPGVRQGAVLTGLEAAATYYIRVFFADDSANWSGLSNGATALATPEPFDQIWGHVVKTSSEGITGVLLEAYDALGNVVASTRTVNDSSGTFKLKGVPAGTFKVQATWTAGDITSSVWLDGIAQGSVNVDFILEINYTLSTLTGTLASLSAQAASPAGFLARAAEDGFRQSRIELLQNGRPIVETSPDPTGRWTISNLLPGRYAVRAFNGLEYTEPQEVLLGEGETQEVVFVFDPLPEAQVFAFPNPARDRTTFRFVSGLPGLEAQVSVFDIAGVLVKELPGSMMVPKPGGLYHADWDLTNDRGESVASGVYLFMVKVRGANGQAGKVIKKLAVVR